MSYIFHIYQSELYFKPPSYSLGNPVSANSRSCLSLLELFLNLSVFRGVYVCSRIFQAFNHSFYLFILPLNLMSLFYSKVQSMAYTDPCCVVSLSYPKFPLIPALFCQIQNPVFGPQEFHIPI